MSETLEILIFRPDASEPERRTIPSPKGFREMKAAFAPLIGGPCEDIEHVSVLFEGRRADMFVDERGALNGQALNAAATEIYHAASKSRGRDARDAPPIHGTAIVSKTIIWT